MENSGLSPSLGNQSCFVTVTVQHQKHSVPLNGFSRVLAISAIRTSIDSVHGERSKQDASNWSRTLERSDSWLIWIPFFSSWSHTWLRNVVNSTGGILSQEPYLNRINSRFLLKIVNDEIREPDRFFTASCISGWFARCETIKEERKEELHSKYRCLIRPSSKLVKAWLIR